MARRKIGKTLLAHCRRTAAEFGVPPAIHPEDHIFWFLIDHPHYAKNRGAAVSAYFSTGNDSAFKVAKLCRQYGVPARPVVLDFASGYGCVARHLKAVQPRARIVCCDIHDQALSFIAGELGIDTLPSSHLPEAFATREGFDVVSAISFFSHMPKATWQQWLQALAHQLKAGGLLIFTTHGQRSLEMQHSGQTLDEEGFSFAARSEQPDLDPAEYGCTFTSFEYVYRQIQETSGVRLLRFDEAFWFGHQDAYVLRRT
jgi:SAM-dependent methyltransferase